ncbi:MAG TPA: sulfite exporter TauE/SafE family protein [Acidimicrobiales bacterium]|nr:sulfite exporter TauE/SafE family protein [Acidimicrobiales bacterium]
MTGLEVLVALAAVAAGSTVQRTLGFGAALVSVPLLLLIDPRLVPGPITIAGLALIGLMLVGTHRDADWRGVRWIAVGLVPGTVVAGVAVALLPQTMLVAGAGLLILAAVGAVLAQRHPPVGRRSLLGSGALSGFMGTTAGVGGPPVALLYHGAQAAVLRATLARVFLVSAVLTLVALAGARRLGTTEWMTGLALMPGGPLGYAVGGRLAGRVDGARLRTGVLVVSALSALAAIARALL